ncbi:hypothetical protein JCM1393_25180 [Clostridium carnis]
MSNTQIMLDEAIKHFGTSDIVTIMLSNRRDKEVAEEQKMKYEKWKRENLNV